MSEIPCSEAQKSTVNPEYPKSGNPLVEGFNVFITFRSGWVVFKQVDGLSQLIQLLKDLQPTGNPYGFDADEVKIIPFFEGEV